MVNNKETVTLELTKDELVALNSMFRTGVSRDLDMQWDWKGTDEEYRTFYRAVDSVKKKLSILLPDS